MTDKEEAIKIAYWIKDTTEGNPGSNVGKLARAYLDLLSQPGEEEVKRMVARLSAMGLVVVPREPSGEMLKAGWDIAGEIECGDLFAVWTAMLTAATKKEKSDV